MLLEPFHQPHHRFFSLRFCAFSSASTFQCRICNRSKSMISVFYQPWTSSAFWFPLPYVPARTMVLRLKSWPMNIASPESPTLEVKPESNIVFIDFVSLCTPHNGCIFLLVEQCSGQPMCHLLFQCPCGGFLLPKSWILSLLFGMNLHMRSIPLIMAPARMSSTWLWYIRYA